MHLIAPPAPTPRCRYSEVYNNHRARQIGRVFFNYCLPVVFAVQLLSQNLPRITMSTAWLVSSIKADLGVHIASWIMYLIDVRKFRTVAYVLDLMSQVTHIVGQWTAYISSWLAPIDEAFT